MSALCEVQFENSPCKVTFSGLLKGTVIVKLSEPITVNGVYLRLFGEANCKFVVPVNKVATVQTNHEEYLDERIVCFEGIKGRARPILPAGIHRYDFECQLNSVPTSVEEPYGNIRYYLFVRFDDNWNSKNPPVHEELFTIINRLNINSIPKLQVPRTIGLRKRYFCCWFLACVKTGEIKIVAHIPRQGYTPGQSIDLELDVDNRSSVNIKEIILKLVKKSKFLSEKEYFTWEHTTAFSAQKVGGLKSYSQETKTYQIVIPSLPPTDEQTSGVINITYKLRVEADVGSFHRNLKLDIPITIGTHPILPKKTPAEPLPESDVLTFEESADIHDENKTKTLFLMEQTKAFIPKYPVYRQTA